MALRFQNGAASQSTLLASVQLFLALVFATESIGEKLSPLFLMYQLQHGGFVGFAFARCLWRVYPNVMEFFDKGTRGFSLRERRCSLRELYGTYVNLSLIEQHLPGGGLTPTGMRVRIAERSTTKMRSFAERTATCSENQPRESLTAFAPGAALPGRRRLGLGRSRCIVLAEYWYQSVKVTSDPILLYRFVSNEAYCTRDLATRVETKETR